ncbi:SDR family NAD(P)-dependent oxidoreductase [Azospirillum thermophilum]|uniref:Short-chain dehydrogenase n=1 Tax=Azospirillum thermophilum TaxID=2202148 RepID=A0A2S2D037_9PROT|nr:SDR family NAD(P)-dependent oxidoreductase [Azospirillum thermophilum]AWK90121.1 short-chain dehydrogenase [Azospirillum thermophilum]
MSSGAPDRPAVFVTGAAQGIGLAIAAAFVRAGHPVALADLNPAVRAEAERLGARGWIVDVREEASLAAAFDAAAEAFGGIGVMVNSAARTAAGPLWDVPAAEWDSVMAVNLRGTFFGCRVAGRHMRGRGWGRIVTMGSYAGRHPSPASGIHYGASKAGVEYLTKAFAAELAPHGVTVNGVAASLIAGPALAAAPPEQVEAVLRTVPLGRPGTVEEVAAAVRFLASDAAGYITGTMIEITGGRGL